MKVTFEKSNLNGRITGFDLQTQTLNKIITDQYNYMILGSERIKLVREAKRIDQCTTDYVN